MSGSGRNLRKRIIVCCDGTGQAAYTAAGTAKDKRPNYVSNPVSNVARIGRAVLRDDEKDGFQQLVIYQMGVWADDETGDTTLPLTGASNKGSLQLLYGKGVLSNIRNAYATICLNYDIGDEVYILGFSRGAWTARSVAGLIGKCGFLTPDGLENFYACWYYYISLPYPERRVERPVSEPGTTRLTDPVTKKQLQIKAVGVWDTVGALESNSDLKTVDWRFHDVTLGPHIENAYHAVALNEHRKAFNCTLWESKVTPRDYNNFEQCWMPGDHSNIGGAHQEQQIADIALAWMMSRLEGLGVKFDVRYLYKEYEKLKTYVSSQGPANQYPPEMSPRQWGEGRSKTMFTAIDKWHDREIGHYCKQSWDYSSGWFGIGGSGDYVKDGDWLENTNETVHAAVRYRRYCGEHQKKLGHDDGRPFDPTNLDGWTRPKKQIDGRVGEGDAPVKGPDPLIWTKDRPNKAPKTGSMSLKLRESELKRIEKIYLAFYETDPDMRKAEQARKREVSIWKLVVGADAPPKDILDIVALIKDPNAQLPIGDPALGPDHTTNNSVKNPVDPAKQPIPESFYFGKQPALDDDKKTWPNFPFVTNHKQVRIGTWNGDNTAVNAADKSYALFSGLSQVINPHLTTITAGYSVPETALCGIDVHYGAGTGAVQTLGAGGSVTRSDCIGTLTLAADERIINYESTAFLNKTTGRYRIFGLKLMTDKGQIWTSPKYQLTNKENLKIVTEKQPAKGWFVKAFYGAQTKNYISRLGAVWTNFYP